AGGDRMQDLPAQEPRRGHEQHAQATVGRSAPPHRSAHRPPRDNTCRRGVCGRRDRTRRRGSREDNAHLGPRHMTTDQFMWLLARVCGLASYASLVIAHALLGGTDFSDPIVSAITWGTAAALITLALFRLRTRLAGAR